jgi:hypothetical protein
VIKRKVDTWQKVFQSKNEFFVEEPGNSWGKESSLNKMRCVTNVYFILLNGTLSEMHRIEFFDRRSRFAEPLNFGQKIPVAQANWIGERLTSISSNEIISCKHNKVQAQPRKHSTRQEVATIHRRGGKRHSSQHWDQFEKPRLRLQQLAFLAPVLNWTTKSVNFHDLLTRWRRYRRVDNWNVKAKQVVSNIIRYPPHIRCMCSVKRRTNP